MISVVVTIVPKGHYRTGYADWRWRPKLYREKSDHDNGSIHVRWLALEFCYYW